MSARGEPGTVYTLHFDPPYRPRPMLRSTRRPGITRAGRRTLTRVSLSTMPAGARVSHRSRKRRAVRGGWPRPSLARGRMNVGSSSMARPAAARSARTRHRSATTALTTALLSARSRYNPNLSANWRRDYDRPRTRNVTTGAAQLAGSDPRPDQNRMEGTDHDNDYHVLAVEG